MCHQPDRAQTPAVTKFGHNVARSALLALPTSRFWPPRIARRRLTAMRRLTTDGDEPQLDLQGHHPTSAVRPPPRSPTQKKLALRRRRKRHTMLEEESLAATFLARPSGCAKGPAPVVV
jgi:hypothetical protein